MALNLAKLVHEKDPAQVIWETVGDLSKFKLAVQSCLVGTYMRPADIKTKGGIFVPNEVSKDDEYQSKVGMIILKGKRAFVDDPENNIFWDGYAPPVGAWVVFRASDGLKCQIPGPGGLHCRVISDVYLRMQIPHPDMVF